MEIPEYLICLDCEAPCYDFEFQAGAITEVVCPACGNEDPEQFLSETQYEELIG
jgi:hypothetical protein